MKSVACPVCHIPAFARSTPTETEWYSETAGDRGRVPVTDPETGNPDYDRMKGDVVWANNVRPTLRYFDGMWNRFLINANDTFTDRKTEFALPR